MEQPLRINFQLQSTLIMHIRRRLLLGFLYAMIVGIVWCMYRQLHMLSSIYPTQLVHVGVQEMSGAAHDVATGSDGMSGKQRDIGRKETAPQSHEDKKEQVEGTAKTSQNTPIKRPKHTRRRKRRTRRRLTQPTRATSNRPSSCPVAIQNAIGLYNSSSKRQSNFSNVVLLTASNNDYSDILRNWEFLAGRLNLKWAVLAMDDEVYEKLGPARAVPTSSSNYSVSGEVLFRSKGFNILSCNKMRSVLSILEDCQVDVIFSDADNVFFHDPFQHDLGNLIKSGAYDYIYQIDEHQRPPGGPRSHNCLTEGQLPTVQGNTGFYFMSWKSQTMKSIVTETLSTCNNPEQTQTDDQTLFWRAMHKIEKGSWQHCQSSVPGAITHPRKEDGKVGVCCLDPFYYPNGLGSTADPEDLISFHANFVMGKEKKIDLLYHARPKDHLGWQQWDRNKTEKLDGP
jgi:hypothetical protein